MALLKAKISEVPADAVILSKSDALQYEMDILSNWRNESDIFGFRYSPAIVATASACVGMYVNSHFRLMFKVLQYGRISSYLPSALIPAALTFVFHTQFITPRVILQDDCPVCIELRSAAIQSFIGCVLPTVMAPLVSLSLATQYGTVNVPFITREPLKVLKLVQSKTKPIVNLLFAIFVGQALLGAAAVYVENYSIQRVHRKIELVTGAAEAIRKAPST